jgi:pimeloyl-ACP methyl ester carboxylesterase
MPARVIIVHGATDSSRSFHAVANLLAEHEVITYDRRGNGTATDALSPSTTIADHVDDLIAVLDERPAVVVGHSLGGVVAMGAAIRRPDLVASLAIYETAMPWASWWTAAARAEMLEQIDTAIERSRTAGDSPRKQRAWAGCRIDVVSMFGTPFDWRALASPLLVGVGTTNRAPSVEDSKRLARELPAQLIELPGAPHHAHITHPDLFAELIERATDLS